MDQKMRRQKSCGFQSSFFVSLFVSVLLFTLTFIPNLVFAQTPQSLENRQAARNVEETVIKDWRVVCPAAGDDALAGCVMVPTTSAPGAGDAPIRLAVELAEDGKSGDTLVVFSAPLDSLLPAGIVFQVDSRRGVKVPFRSCHEFGCLAPFQPSQSILNSFIRGLDMKVAALGLDGTQRSAIISLRGFTAALRELRKTKNP